MPISNSPPPLFLFLLALLKHQRRHPTYPPTHTCHTFLNLPLYIYTSPTYSIPPPLSSFFTCYLLFAIKSQSMVVSDQFVLCKAALIFAVTRWLLSFALNLLTTSMGVFSDSSSPPQPSSSCWSNSPPSAANLRLLRGSLSLTTFGDMEQRLPEGHDDSCAVCLNGLKKSSQVWELSNCCHVFHKHCLERWLAYDNRLTCPLCRASLIHVRPLPPASQPESPSWAVERMLYLFGDDLLPWFHFLGFHHHERQFFQCPSN